MIWLIIGVWCLFFIVARILAPRPTRQLEQQLELMDGPEPTLSDTDPLNVLRPKTRGTL